jgi:hypothetical protein
MILGTSRAVRVYAYPEAVDLRGDARSPDGAARDVTVFRPMVIARLTPS